MSMLNAPPPVGVAPALPFRKPPLPVQAGSVRQPHFRGVGDAVSTFVGFIDSNRMAELVMSDGLGMVVPRTAVSLTMRGPDDGRETIIREAAGLLCVTLLCGWLNHVAIRMAG